MSRTVPHFIFILKISDPINRIGLYYRDEKFWNIKYWWRGKEKLQEDRLWGHLSGTVSSEDQWFCDRSFTVMFVELHKESRRLENEVDLKLLSFSKLGSNYTQRDSR